MKTHRSILFDHRMHDGSRNFLSLPESVPWTATREHIAKLDGAETNGVLTDDVAEVWIDFRYKEHRFTINNQFGEYWFFVENPLCPDPVLREVADHFQRLLDRV